MINGEVKRLGEGISGAHLFDALADENARGSNISLPDPHFQHMGAFLKAECYHQLKLQSVLRRLITSEGFSLRKLCIGRYPCRANQCGRGKGEFVKAGKGKHICRSGIVANRMGSVVDCFT